MEDNCPYCDCVVTSECKAFLCESCDKYVHYLCSELPTYSIMLLLKSQRKFICKSCVLAKYQDFPALPGELDSGSGSGLYSGGLTLEHSTEV